MLPRHDRPASGQASEYMKSLAQRLEKEHPDCCGCRVRQIAPLNGLQPANWAADLFETRCEGPCLDHVSEVIGQMQRHCDVAW